MSDDQSRMPERETIPPAPSPQDHTSDAAIPHKPQGGNAPPSSPSDEKKQRIRVKNRRKMYLDTHPTYFDSPDLEIVDPLLYDRCVRRFQSTAEREADGRAKGYSGVLEADLYRSEAKLAALSGRALSDEGEGGAEKAGPRLGEDLAYVPGPDGQVLPEDEDEIPQTKEEGMERWREAMTLRFLRGGDEDFEYGDVDGRDDWDVIEREDEEEHWFEEEEPETRTIRVATPLRSFSASTKNEGRTNLRRKMYAWLNGHGRVFREPMGSANYLGAYDNKGNRVRSVEPGKPPSGPDLSPFPKNESFRSQPVTSEELRELVWEKIMKNGLSVKEVSVELNIEMSRVGAIVRLKEVEKAWQRQGKRLAKPYSRAVMDMMPQTPCPSRENGNKVTPHESINDLPVHAATQQQIFYPTSESRQFNRVDAARVFADGLLPADLRVPHPELIEDDRLRLQGVGQEDIAERAAARSKAAYEKKTAADKIKRAREAAAVKTVPGVRWDFKFREISVDAAGPTGRGKNGTGWRYGVPLYDRRRGEVKIPTKVV
ncbi:hypothetical protein O988_05239 [Pseudogymnoascus sp. VKM F-3808]|nr:hypothetical protein O988_05239 [Pseudogymnoascus sp. VKM F-3808]